VAGKVLEAIVIFILFIVVDLLLLPSVALLCTGTTLDDQESRAISLTSLKAALRVEALFILFS